MTSVLGLSAHTRGSAAALVVDGEVVAAAEEERFSRHPRDDSMPEKAIAWCLAEAGLEPRDLDFVAFFEKPFLEFERVLKTCLAAAPAGFGSFLATMPHWLDKRLHLRREIGAALGGKPRNKLVFAAHHESQAAGAFFPSPFGEAAILTAGGDGEWATATVGVGRGHRIRLERQLRYPHSLGRLLEAFAEYCGFDAASGPQALASLAARGEPEFADRILDKLLELAEDGSFRLAAGSFHLCRGRRLTTERFHRLLGGPPRRPEEEISPRHANLARSVQEVAGEVLLRMGRYAHAVTGMKRLCLAVGGAVDGVAAARLLREGPFEDVWTQAAPDGAGGALGVALLVWHQLLGNPRIAAAGDGRRRLRLGPGFEAAEIESALAAAGAAYERIDDPERRLDRVAADLAAGRVVGWFEGRLELGPRALLSRAILADPRIPEVARAIQQRIQYREPLRPLPAIVLAERAREFLEMASSPSGSSAPISVPASDARPVAEGDGEIRSVLERFHRETGCPALAATSLHRDWEPIACTPRQACRVFLSTEMDVLSIGPFLVDKAAQRSSVGPLADPAPVFAGKVASPCCESELREEADDWVCRRCGHRFPVTDGIARFFWPHEELGRRGDVTEIVQAFYEEHPFPDYDDHDSVRSLIEKSRAGGYARLLEASIPFNSDVLEVGCGTGQLTNFLSVSLRQVIGTDLCLNSLALGEAFRRRHALTRARFVQMNLFRPAFRPERFDVVICNGVLHHTSDPHRGFRGLVPLVKPGGHLVVGLYNRWGRLATDLRRQLFRLSGDRARWIDPVLRRKALSAGKRRSWFADQYRHPHESKHTFGEVLRWFDRAGIEFVRGVPALRPEDDGLEGPTLFAPQPRGDALEHFLVQAGQIFAPGQREGGFFIMIGRKPDA